MPPSASAATASSAPIPCWPISPGSIGARARRSLHHARYGGKACGFSQLRRPSSACPVELHVQKIQLAVSGAKIVAAQIFFELDVERTEFRRRLDRLHRAADVIERMVRRPGMLAVILGFDHAALVIMRLLITGNLFAGKRILGRLAGVRIVFARAPLQRPAPIEPSFGDGAERLVEEEVFRL